MYLVEMFEGHEMPFCYWKKSNLIENLVSMTVLTDKGFLHKSVVYEGGSHIIEEIQLLKNPQPIKTLLLSTKEVKLSALYVSIRISN